MERFGWPESVAICVVALAVAAIFMPWQQIGGDFWEAAGAVGTIAAAVVALGLGLRDGMRRHREGRYRAALTAKILEPKIVLAHQQMHRFSKDWDEHPYILMLGNYQDTLLKLAQIRDSLPLTGIQDLASAPGGCAIAVSAALSEVLYLIELLTQYQGRKPQFDIDTLIDSARRSSEKFSRAADLCEAAENWLPAMSQAQGGTVHSASPQVTDNHKSTN